MALDDALGDGNAALRDSLLRQYQQGDSKFATDAGVLDRLARKLTPLVSGGLTTPADTSPPVAPPTPQPEKAPDLSRFGTPVESAPEPSTADLSKFGTPVAEPAPVALATLGIGGNLLAAGKGLLRGAPEAVGGIVQGIATAQPTQPIAPKGSALIDQLANASQMSTSQRAILMGQAMRAIGDRGLQIDFNAALQRIARGGDAQAEADTLRAKVAAQNAAAAGPITEQAKYKTGTAIKDAIDQLVPMTDQEKASAGGRLGTMASGIAPYAAATLAGGPAIGMAAGFTGMAADAYGQVYNDAKAKGARDDVATNAARKSALVAGVLGSLPLGAGKYAQSLIAKVASSSAAFATAGEAQEAILQQIAKDYDPKAGYSFDQKRLLAELILGAGLGGLHHAVGDHQEEPAQPAVEASQQPPVGEIPKGSASVRPDTGPDATAPGADVPPPGPDTGSPGAANTGDQPQQMPPPSASEPARPGKSQDFVMDPQTRSKMERVMRHIDPTSDVGKMSDADVFNTLQEHLRAGSKGRPETSDEIAARQEAATTRIERDGLIRRGWDSVWVDAMTPQQRREAFQEAMAGGTETPLRPAGGGEAATPPKTDYETLLDAGFSEQEIADMSPRARAQRLEELKPPTTESDVAPTEPAPAAAQEPQKTDPEATGKRDAPVVATTVDDVLKASDVAKEPTPAQAVAGNYQHGHLEIPQLDLTGKNGISIETGVGQIRRGTDPNGKPWEVRMPVAYGKIKGTVGADGDHLDVFVGPKPTSPHVFIIDQRDPSNDSFDEHKIMVGFEHPEAAVRAYRDSYSDDATPRIGAVTALGPEEFKNWLAIGDHTKRFSPPGQNEQQPENTLERPVPTSRTAPKPDAGSTEPMTLMQFIASKGGLAPHPELNALDLGGDHRVHIPGRSGFFSVVRPTGMNLDHMRELAEEAGYLRGGHNATSTVRDFLDAIDEEFNRGNPKKAEGEESALTQLR